MNCLPIIPSSSLQAVLERGGGGAFQSLASLLQILITLSWSCSPTASPHIPRPVALWPPPLSPSSHTWHEKAHEDPQIPRDQSQGSSHSLDRAPLGGCAQVQAGDAQQQSPKQKPSQWWWAGSSWAQSCPWRWTLGSEGCENGPHGALSGPYC